jgi:hypothetical protein
LGEVRHGDLRCEDCRAVGTARPLDSVSVRGVSLSRKRFVKKNLAQLIPRAVSNCELFFVHGTFGKAFGGGISMGCLSDLLTPRKPRLRDCAPPQKAVVWFADYAWQGQNEQPSDSEKSRNPSQIKSPRENHRCSPNSQSTPMSRPSLRQTGRIHFTNPSPATTACPRGRASFKHIRAVLTRPWSAKSRQ